MNFELRQAQRRFEEEQQRAKERARRQAERERRVKEEADARKAAEEEAQKRQRQEEAARVAEAQRQLEADLEKGGGIALRRVLRVLRVPGTGDRITLPPSLLQDLPLDPALDRGPMFFEVSAPPTSSGAQDPSIIAATSAPSFRESAGSGQLQEGGGRREGGAGAEEEEEEGGRATHAGVSEFTAPEGCVGLPDHVLRNLLLKLGTLRAPLDPLEGAAEALAEVRVRYVRLPKGRQVQLQPVGASAGAFGALVADQKAALEGRLRGFATLTDGDVLVMPLGAHRFALRVTHLRPEGKVSVIDTDLEVDLVLPPPAHSPVPAPNASGIAAGRGFGNPSRSGTAAKGAKGVPFARPGAASQKLPAPGAAGDQLVTVLAPGQEMEVRVGPGEWRFFKVAGRQSPPPPAGGPSSPADSDGTKGGSSSNSEAGSAQDVLVSVHWNRPRGLPAWRTDLGQGDAGAVSRAVLSDRREDMEVDRGSGSELGTGASVGGAQEGGALEVDLYASVPPVVYPSLLDHAVRSLSLGPKQLRIPVALLGPASSSGQCVVGAHAVRGPGEFAIKAELVPAVDEPASGAQLEPQARVAEDGAARQGLQKGGLQGGLKVVPEELVGDGLVECGNCRTRVAPHRLVLHEAFCRRNNALCPVASCQAVLLRADLARGTHRHCPVCEELITHGYSAQEPGANQGPGASSGVRGSTGVAGRGGEGLQEEQEAALVEAALQKHVAAFHTARPCECGASIEMKDMAAHRGLECPQRWILCGFCGLSARAEGAPPSARDAARGLTAHEAACGSRTAPCETCGAPVVLKDSDLHYAAFHAPPEVARQMLADLQSRGQLAPQVMQAGAGHLPPSGRDRDEPQLRRPVVRGSAMEEYGHASGFPMEEEDFPDVSAQGGVPAQGSLNVSCPLCGEMVHSERHLSQHIDAVH